VEELRREIKALQEQVATLTELVRAQPFGHVVQPDGWYTYDDLVKITGYKKGTLQGVVSKGKLKRSPNAVVFHGEEVLRWLKPKVEEGVPLNS
jgi:hypothetical protein